MRIVGIGGETSVRFGPPPHRPAPKPKPGPATSGRSLVPVMPPVAAEPDPSAAVSRRSRPSAPFMAHMIATHLGLAQTRARRRASFGEAAALYGAGRPRDGGARILSASA